MTSLYKLSQPHGFVELTIRHYPEGTNGENGEFHYVPALFEFCADIIIKAAKDKLLYSK